MNPILAKAREIIAEPKNWCQNDYRRFDSKGYANSQGDTYRYCAVGALGEAWQELGETVETLTLARALLGNASRQLFQQEAIDVNDNLGHAQILQAFDLALTLVPNRHLASP